MFEDPHDLYMPWDVNPKRGIGSWPEIKGK